MLARKLADEIAFQLEKDILSYDWLFGITQRLFPEQSFDNRAEILVDAIQLLCLEIGIRVGQSELQRGKVHIAHWGANVDETMDQVRKFIVQNGENVSFADGFWIGLPLKDNDRTKR
jgi:hypothetical protein